MNRPAVSRFAHCMARDVINIWLCLCWFTRLAAESTRKLIFHTSGLIRSLFQAPQK